MNPEPLPAVDDGRAAADALLDALTLPASTHVGSRVPKALLAENGAATAADRRLLTAGVEELRWTHTVKPTTAGVPAFHDDARDYLEIAVLRLTARNTPQLQRLVGLVHRAVPYPVVLVTEAGPVVSLSLVHKRAALNEAGRVVLDGDTACATLAPETAADMRHAFLSALPLALQPRQSLFTLYQGWIDAAHAFEASTVAGDFALPASAEHAEARRQALADLARLDAEIAAVRRAAQKEKQVARRADLNLRLAGLRTDRQAALDAL